MALSGSLLAFEDVREIVPESLRNLHAIHRTVYQVVPFLKRCSFEEFYSLFLPYQILRTIGEEINQSTHYQASTETFLESILSILVGALFYLFFLM